MANFYYQSESLGKVMYLADIEALSVSDLQVLEEELSKAIEDIKTQMYEQRDTAEFDKIHAMSLKVQICKKFMTRLKQVQQDESSKMKAYHLSYFRQAVSTLIGPLQADQLYEKAKQDALSQLAKELNS
jgi:uncharacterized protein YkuJ